ncbi:MAG: TonB-dependent receptor [Bryobacterales bacterium]|nr:TonB-dependent receptor [Bryobacterales bacterium]
MPALLAVLATLLCSSVSFGQTGQGIITGLVTDSSGAIMPGVTVTVRNPETDFTYKVVTNAEGLYRVLYLNPGYYEISYEVQGFKRLVRSNIQVRSTETTRVDVTMEIGSVAESVEVTGAAPLLETETSMAGHLVTAVTVTRIPNPQRHIYSLPWIFPSVTSQGGWGHAVGQRSRSFNVTLDGVPGVEPVRGGLDSGNRSLSSPEENMEEVKILTSVLPAEYGHSGGGVMNITYKSGTNQLHGVAKERYTGKSMIHRNWHDAAVPRQAFGYHVMGASLSGPVLLPKLYDGRNRTFFMTGFQRHHEKVSENNDVTIPSPAMLAGDFSFGGMGDTIYDPATLIQLPSGSYSRTPFPGNVIPKGRFDPAVQKFLTFDPWNGEDNRNNQMYMTRQGPQSNRSADTRARYYLTGYDFKIDHAISDNHKIFGRFSDYRRRGPGNGRWQVAVKNPIFDYQATNVPSDQSQLMLSDSIIISPTTINEVRLGATRRKFTRIPESLDQNWAGKIGIPNVGPETMPSFLTSSGGQLYSRFPEGKTSEVTENINFQENLTMVRGRHSFKTGYEILRTRANTLVPSQPSGRYYFGGTEFPYTPNTGNAFASLLLGSVTRADFTTALATWLPRWWTHSFYLQDDWKVSRLLTLNLGLRWQYETPYNTKYGQQSQFSPTETDALTGRRGALLHPAGPLAKRDLNNLAPRVGLAYNFQKDWVFRAGFAVNTLDIWTNGLQENFDEYYASATVQQSPGNPDVAFYLSKGPPSIPFRIAPNGTAPFVGTNYSGRSASYYDPNIRSPYVMNWNAGFQWQFSRTMVVEFTYQGSAGVGLLNQWNINAIPLNISSDPAELNRIRQASQNYLPYTHFGGITHYSNWGHNTFHSGMVRFEKRYSHGLTLTSHYTRSKSIDEDSDDASAGGITFYNRSLEKARSDYDVTNRWVTYATYEFPIGKGRALLGSSNRAVQAILGNWQLSVIQTLENGAPFSFTFSGTSNVYLPGGLRPNMAPGKTYGDIKIPWDSHGPCRFNRSCDLPWADINAFAYPASFTPGQAGRNIQTGPGILWHQVSVMKEFSIRERLKARIKYDVNNPFKRYFFSRPGNSVDFRNPQNFGKITSSSGSFSGLVGRLYQSIEVRLEF